MKALPYVGCYRPDPGCREARTVGNFTTTDVATLLHDPADAEGMLESGLSFIAAIPDISQALLLDPEAAPEWPRIVANRERLRAAGVLERVLAILMPDEAYGHLEAGEYQHWPALQGFAPSDPGVIAAFRDGLSRYAAALKRLYHVPVGGVDTAWPIETRPLPAYDFAGLDVYHPTGETMPPLDRLSAGIRRMYQATRQAYPHTPILGVPQAFTTADAPWRRMVTVEEMRAQLEAITECEGVIGIAWFCMDFRRYGNIERDGLVRYPAQLQAAREYWRFCQRMA